MPDRENQEPEEYFMTITMTTGRYGRKRDYQSNTFVQNFTDHEEQILAMQKVFPAVLAAGGAAMVEVGNDGIEKLRKGK